MLYSKGALRIQEFVLLRRFRLRLFDDRLHGHFRFRRFFFVFLRQMQRRVRVLRAMFGRRGFDFHFAQGFVPAVLFRETDFWAQGINVGVEYRW